MKQLKEKEYEEFQKYQYNKIHGYIWTPDTIEMICAVGKTAMQRICSNMPVIRMWVRLPDGRLTRASRKVVM